MEISQDDIVEITQTPYQLFEKAVPNPKTWQFYRNMTKRIVCGYLKTILTDDSKLVEQQKQEMTSKGEKLHYRKDYYDADWQVRVNELVQRARENPKWIESVLITLVSKLMERTKLPKTDPDYIKSTMVENTFKPLRKLFSMTDVPIAWGKNGVIQFKNERIAILQRRVGAQVQFIVAYDDLTKEGYRLMAIDEGKETTAGGFTGGSNAYFYFQKIDYATSS